MVSSSGGIFPWASRPSLSFAVGKVITPSGSTFLLTSNVISFGFWRGYGFPHFCCRDMASRRGDWNQIRRFVRLDGCIYSLSLLSFSSIFIIWTWTSEKCGRWFWRPVPTSLTGLYVQLSYWRNDFVYGTAFSILNLNSLGTFKHFSPCCCPFPLLQMSTDYPATSPLNSAKFVIRVVFFSFLCHLAFCAVTMCFDDNNTFIHDALF